MGSESPTQPVPFCCRICCLARPRALFAVEPGEQALGVELEVGGEDLVDAGSGVGDAMTASKAVGAYRAAPPTGTKGLQDINTKKGN